MKTIGSKRRHAGIDTVLALCLSTLALGICQARSQQVKSTVAGVQPNTAGDLRILYVGHPGSEREKDFVGFLGRYFTTVETGDLKAFSESRCRDFDVSILDYDGDGFKAPRVSVSDHFSKPLITVGVPGGLMCSQWGLKTGYL